MSIKCPKRNQVFLKWLKSNRSRFPFQPRVTACRKKWIDFEFIGITDALRFSFSSRAGITIEVIWKGECWDLIRDFDVAEERADEGWMCRLDLPEKQQYWRTREDLWIEHCFEPFLSWCNEELAEAIWLELYRQGGGTAARIHKERPSSSPNRETLKELFDNLDSAGKPYIEKSTDQTQYVFIPIHRRKTRTMKQAVDM